MKVSIITAVRNETATIGCTLESVRTQDHPDIEHLVVDGASTDGTLEAVRASPARVAQVVSEPDRGIYDAFNKGLRLASGEIVGFLNSGDSYCSPSIISEVASEFTDESIDAVFGDLLIVDPRDQSRVLRYYSSGGFRPDRLAWGFMPAHPTLFLRRRVYEDIGGYDPTYQIAGDFELCLRVFLPQPIRYRYLPEALVRMPSGGISNRGWRSMLIITREMRRACLQNAVPTNVFKLSSRLPLKMLEMLSRGR